MGKTGRDLCLVAALVGCCCEGQGAAVHPRLSRCDHHSGAVCGRDLELPGKYRLEQCDYASHSFRIRAATMEASATHP